MSFSQIQMYMIDLMDLSVYEYWVDYTLNSLDRKPKKMLDYRLWNRLVYATDDPFRCYSVTGIDILMRYMLEVARQEVVNLPNVEFKYGDMTRLSADLRGFDLVTCYLDSLLSKRLTRPLKRRLKGCIALCLSKERYCLMFGHRIK